tara:strand:+ start:101 stop:346 length:246 start_codon:yes stop_codon:yes gene_type:complete
MLGFIKIKWNFIVIDTYKKKTKEIKMKLTKQDKQELNRWFEQPVKTETCTIQLVGATEKEWEKFCVLADTYLAMKRMELPQ